MNAPEPDIERHKTGLRLIWVVPIAAAIVGITLLLNTWRERGPSVTITFENGEGLDVGKTLVKYRNVTIGRVSQVKLDADRTHVEVVADLTKSAADLAVDGTRFWVVRPRIGVGWATGLDTLLSGAYIGVESGPGEGKRTRFAGLESPPPLRHRAAGKQVVLEATELGSISVGSPVYFRRFQVGQVIDEYLDEKTHTARVVLFVNAPHDQAITRATRFWNASGVDVSINSEGLKVRSQSVASVLAGGVAFDAGTDVPDADAPAGGADFMLYKDEPSAMAPPDGEPHTVRMRFNKALRGLTVGAPIEFVGVDIGSVTAIDVGYDAATARFPVFVTGTVFPRRMGLAYTTIHAGGKGDTDDDLARLAAQLVARGLRVQPHSGSLLTGRLYLALDFVPASPKITFNPAARPIELPTLDGNLGELESGLNQVVAKINALPLHEVVTQANEDLRDLHGTLQGVNAGLLPAAVTTLSTLQQTLRTADALLTDDSPFRGEVEDTLGDLQTTLRSVKALAETLNRHPEALIRGRAKDPSPAPATSRAPRP
jgi:paraquat-inducible protein B